LNQQKRCQSSHLCNSRKCFFSK